MAMDERDEIESEAVTRPDRPPRKPWHAPQFLITSLSATDTMCNAGNDGVHGAPSLS